ncbi:YrdB family protein [Agromyces sp. SYSU T00194]|uniref:YrdB family protein n=1 Tax=Agromyces chitinivorans TaxID=3158560 RepID=UPI0033962074
MSESPNTPAIGPNDIVRFFLELFAFVSLGIWGFLAWPLPWPGVLIGIGAPALAILAWALFVSPKAVFRVDVFGRTLVELAVMLSAALAWWGLGQPIVAVVFTIVATVSGILHGRRQLAD